jgi:hypothetical protein
MRARLGEILSVADPGHAPNNASGERSPSGNRDGLVQRHGG